MTTEFIVTAAAKLLEQLSKRMKSKNDFDIVREIQKLQKELETNTTKAEAKVAELEKEITRLKEAHSDEITRLKKEHAAEIARLSKPHVNPPWMEDVGGPL